MRSVWLVLVLALTACGNVRHELPHTSASDPVWPLNAGKWVADSNDLTTPPVIR
jgi:hypothetical protein